MIYQKKIKTMSVGADMIICRTLHDADSSFNQPSEMTPIDQKCS